MRREVAEGRFREDLYYRLNVFPINVPPLRERPRDIVPMMRFLLQRHANRHGKPTPDLAESARQKLEAHSWPGNVRELDNVAQRALILSAGGVVDADSIMFEADTQIYGMGREPEFTETLERAAPVAIAENATLGANLRSTEHDIILDVLNNCSGSRKAAAERLGISERTLRYKLAKMRDDGVAIP
jgi:two-component system response regulator FlrC